MDDGSIEAGPRVHPQVGDGSLAVDLDVGQQLRLEAGEHVDESRQVLEEEELKHRLDIESIKTNLYDIDNEMNETVSTINNLDLMLQQIEEYFKQKTMQGMVKRLI